ncbi:hypothetical protein Tco_0377895 [Tanacetum coccineum]
MDHFEGEKREEAAPLLEAVPAACDRSYIQCISSLIPGRFMLSFIPPSKLLLPTPCCLVSVKLKLNGISFHSRFVILQ